MPLSTGAQWPTLKAGFTAAAEDMTAKFEWVEGHRYPMVGGVLADGTYNIGSSDYKWDGGYFNEVDSPVFYSDYVDSGKSIRAYGRFSIAGGTITAVQSQNISSVVYNSSFPGRYDFLISNMIFFTGPSSVVPLRYMTAISSSARMVTQNRTNSYMMLFDEAGNYVDSDFCLMALGPINWGG